MSGHPYKQPWIYHAAFDTVWILSPAFLALLVVYLLPASMKSGTEMPLAAWVILILLIDVAHVYSTLFRTYMDPVRFRKQRDLFLAVPVICYMAGVLLYSIDNMLFWRLLAYLAVFHFVRQQYGFMRLYSRFDAKHKLAEKIDTATIYTATLYPIIWWHLHPGRTFNWFVDGGFLSLELPWLLPVASVLYTAIIAAYLVKELLFSFKTRTFNIPKNAIIVGTILSWSFGIIYFNGDLVFTLLNVVSHGIPYMALIWIMGKKEHNALTQKNKFSKVFLQQYGIALFIGILFLLAWTEEAIWDGLVWKEHDTVFFTGSLPKIKDINILALLVPLLSLPQAVHYVLDGFIWRRTNRS